MNHAAILTWGWFNEGPSNFPDACPAYAACASYSRSRDPTRFTTWADDQLLRGACYEHATLIAFNNYPGWYSRVGDVTAPAKTWKAMAEAAHEGSTRSGNGTVGKPFV